MRSSNDVDPTTGPDRILLGGPITTMAPSHPTLAAMFAAGDGAMAVRDGRIIGLGRRDEIVATRTRSTEVVDLVGRAAIAGLVEPHTHPDLAAQMGRWVDVSGFTHPSVTGVETALRAAIETTPAGEWIHAFGLDFMLTEGLGVWHRDRLDALAPHHPLVVMIQSMHTVFVNSLALERVGIDESTPQPGHGGHRVIGPDGRLTGQMEEAAATGPFIEVAGVPPEQLDVALREQYRRYADVGITTVGMAGSFTAGRDFGVFERLGARDDTEVGVVAYLRHGPALSGRTRPGRVNDGFTIAGVKLWYDGSPYTGSMLLDEAYLESELCCCTLGIAPDTVGRANFEPDELIDILTRLRDARWQVMTHAQGDRACREMMELYARVLGPTPPPDHRWRLEHCALITADTLADAASLGVSPSFHVDHIRWYGPELADHIIGPDRAARLMPVQTSLACGHRPSLHADTPMYPPGPLRLAGTAATRRTRLGTTLGPAERVSVIEALRAVTIDAAWQLGVEESVGSLEVGKVADLTICDRDPAAAGAEDLEHIDVVETWRRGRTVSSG